jgi:hypothetical protein
MDASHLNLHVLTKQINDAFARFPHHQFVPSEPANNIPRSSAPGGENGFMLGWVL